MTKQALHKIVAGFREVGQIKATHAEPESCAAHALAQADMWDAFFAAPGLDLDERDQPRAQMRETI